MVAGLKKPIVPNDSSRRIEEREPNPFVIRQENWASFELITHTPFLTRLWRLIVGPFNYLFFGKFKL